ncbi:MAG: hypothetical protein LKI77_06860 [Bifidobacterium sp.]|jgi:hypothetical protein|nr:hypothetical protein [Bifidobacterium sp.]
MDFIVNTWQWLVDMNSGLQSVLVLVAIVAAFALAYVARGMQNNYDAEPSAARNAMAVALYVIAVLLAIIALVALAAVFAQLIGI